ncbi:MAG TPA: hypothetical protein VK595_02230 [Vicinamibacterales bacterium]|jgi:hypothetical protein|nr:hypothetical protein [Vicinamibacterales bacterium]
MTLRIGFDMDGTLADFGRAFHEVEARLFGPAPGISEGYPEREEEAQAEALETPPIVQDRMEVSPSTPQDSRRRRSLIWKAIQATPDFWCTLHPIEADAVRRIHALMLMHKWEVFFITQRPYTSGDTVQRQTQKWLVDQGFDLPSVLVLGGTRGTAAAALRLSYHVDDSPQNCMDVISDSRARPVLIVPDTDEIGIASAHALGIGTVPGIGACLDVLERATLAAANPSLFERLASMVGWW